jgi:hypothetical protein
LNVAYGHVAVISKGLLWSGEFTKLYDSYVSKAEFSEWLLLGSGLWIDMCQKGLVMAHTWSIDFIRL